FFEAVSRGFLSIDAFRFRITNYDQETWWRLSWIERSARGVKIFYAFDEYHPARGWALRPDVRSLVAFDNGATVSSNAQGIRGRREYADQRPPGVTRVLVFGDSLTFGDEVSDDETYAAQLERMLPATEVINLGVHGYGHDQMLLYLEEVGARYRPDLVLLGFVGIDMERNLLGFRDFAKPRFDLEGPRLVLRNTPVPRAEEVLAEERSRPRFLDLLALVRGELRALSGRDRDATLQQVTAAILDQFRRSVVQVGATPVLAYLPVDTELLLPSL